MNGRPKLVRGNRNKTERECGRDRTKESVVLGRVRMEGMGVRLVIMRREMKNERERITREREVGGVSMCLSERN